MPHSQPARKRARVLVQALYDDLTMELVYLSKTIQMLPIVLLREAEPEDRCHCWSVETLEIEPSFLENFMAFDPDAQDHAIHKVVVRVPANAAASEVQGSEICGVCVSYLGQQQTRISALDVLASIGEEPASM